MKMFQFRNTWSQLMLINVHRVIRILPLVVTVIYPGTSSILSSFSDAHKTSIPKIAWYQWAHENWGFEQSMGFCMAKVSILGHSCTRAYELLKSWVLTTQQWNTKFQNFLKLDRYELRNMTKYKVDFVVYRNEKPAFHYHDLCRKRTSA